ncbi:hypothetical protein TNCT_345081 [Trichonephila clavata]|uniref:Uncharacterized protein n=1 Tax=Trichonephila clavata TaxID=2740835 RepID=A0A8X6LZ85_TRICU|nr:hypothetical protein TNCT_345081 [Trichonephila clavata]
MEQRPFQDVVNAVLEEGSHRRRESRCFYFEATGEEDHSLNGEELSGYLQKSLYSYQWSQGKTGMFARAATAFCTVCW